MFERVLYFHDRIRAIVDRSEAILRNSSSQDVIALGNGRWELARTLREYQLFKQSLFDRFERTPGHHAVLARRMRAECIRSGEEFRAYVLKWSAVSVLDNWHRYQPAALAAIARVRAQLAQERAGMAELLEERSEAA